MKDWATTEKKIVTSSIATNHISVRQCLHFGLTNENTCLIYPWIYRLNFNVNILSWENPLRSKLSFDCSIANTLSPVWPEGGNFPILWDFWPKRGDRFLRMGICGINSKRGGFWRISQKIGKFSYFSTKCWHFCLKIS